MNLQVQKRLAATIFRSSPKRVWFDEERLSDIKEAITKADLIGLVKDGAIRLKPIKSISRGRIRQRKGQKSRGMRKGAGSRKGGWNARTPKKALWMIKIRVQREFIRMIKEKGLITKQTYHDLYSKSKGGFFRSKRHIKVYLEEHNLFIKTGAAVEATKMAATEQQPKAPKKRTKKTE
jgi:large subunit ribosomal protein L19e